LDVILFNDEIEDPRLWSHAYLAVPMAELIPDLPDPKTGKTLADLAKVFVTKGGLTPHPEIAG